MASESDLSLLIERLREDAEETTEYGYENGENTLGRATYLAKAEGIRYAADELEELIDDD